jgi:hypothetical protein
MQWWERIDQILTHRRLSYAWIAGGGLWIAWLLSVLLGPGYMDLANQVVGTDYLQFYTAGMTIRMGEGEKLYDFEYQSQLEQSIAGPELTGYHAFITPPFFSLLFAPLSMLPYGLSFAVWSIIGLLGLWLGLKWLGSENPRKSFLWSLTWFPVFATISFGQNSLLSLTILSLTFLLWRKRRYFLAGLVCSLVLYKPQLALGVGLLWLLDWRDNWKALLGLMIGGVSLASISFLFMPEASQAYIEFTLKVLPEMMTWEGFPLWHSHTIRAFWLLLIPNFPGLSEALTILCSALAILFFIRFWMKNRNQSVILYAAAICLTILITPHAMIYDWVILLIPAVLLWEYKQEFRSLWLASYALIWIVSLISGPLTFGQLQILPVAIQISVPLYIFLLYCAYKQLGLNTKNRVEPLSTSTNKTNV